MSADDLWADDPRNTMSGQNILDREMRDRMAAKNADIDVQSARITELEAEHRSLCAALLLAVRYSVPKISVPVEEVQIIRDGLVIAKRDGGSPR